MSKLAYFLGAAIGLAAVAACASAVASDGAVAEPSRPAASGGAAAACGDRAERRKNTGDMSYRAAWRLQQKVAALRPRDAQLISPLLRLSIAGMDPAARAEFLPPDWGVAIVGKTLDTVVPMQRGGYFAVPPLSQAQARQEDAIVMFNAHARKNSVDVGWQLSVPASGRMGYRQFGQALEELKLAQAGIAWWDFPLAQEKKARFDALRACFASGEGEILVGGRPAGRRLSEHCSLLAFDPDRLGADPAIAFVGQLEQLTLDDTASYAPARRN